MDSGSCFIEGMPKGRRLLDVTLQTDVRDKLCGAITDIETLGRIRNRNSPFEYYTNEKRLCNI